MFAVLAPLAALPWLLGFGPTASADHPRRDVAEQLAEWSAPDDRCVASAYGGLAVDLPGGQRVLASYSQGVFVLDADHHLVAQAPGLHCSGSADELVGLAVGDVWIGTPVIALAATAGGRAESVTWLTLLRVGNTGVLETVFAGAVERTAEHRTRTGAIILVPGGLIYREPGGATSIWTYDRHMGRYITHGTIAPVS
jgi:hypothetical protein